MYFTENAKSNLYFMKLGTVLKNMKIMSSCAHWRFKGTPLGLNSLLFTNPNDGRGIAVR